MITAPHQIELHAILNLISDSVILITDLSGKVVLTNRESNCQLKEGDSLFQFLDREATQIGPLIEGLVKKHQTFSVRSTLSEGGVGTLYDLRFSPILSSQGDIQLLFIEAKDISTEQAFSNKLKRATSDHSSLIEHANAIIIGVDSLGYITDWNKNCEATLGLTARDVFARHLSDVLTELSNQPTIIQRLTPAFSGSPQNNLECTVITKEGKPVTLLLSATPRKNSKNQVDGVLLLGHDITELNAYRISLEEKVKERTERLNESNREIIRQKEAVEKEQERSDRLLLNIMPVSIANELKKAGRVIPRHYPAASILFADLVGFTKISRSMKPEQLLHELDQIFVGFDLILERHGLEKIKMLGDGYMAAAGVPLPLDQHASEAVRAGLSMIDHLERLNANQSSENHAPWKIRIGIHSGDLIAGVIGKRKLAYDVWGATVNTASQVESVGKPGYVTVSESTYELIAEEFECDRIGPVSNEKLNEIILYRVLSERVRD